jgi:glutamate racemase
VEENFAPIGVFDSGVGGLTVLNALRHVLPEETLFYLGDTARVPYGNRSAETVCQYALQASRFLIEKDVKALVIACNTASAYALERLKEKYSIPVIGVIDSVAHRAAKISQTQEVAVLGTRGTIRSESYVKALQKEKASIKIHARACPLLVPLAEEGWSDKSVSEEIIYQYLKDLKNTDVDTLILGCTHYPLLKGLIQKVAEGLLGRSLFVLDSGPPAAEALKTLLRTKGLLVSQGSQAACPRGKTHIHVTDYPEGFEETAKRFFDAAGAVFTHVDL